MPPSPPPPKARSEVSPATAPPVPKLAAPAQTPPESLPATTKTWSTGDVVARGATYYRLMRYIMVLVLIGAAGWFAYDGYKGWPAENATIAELNRELNTTKDPARIDELKRNDLIRKPPHTSTD